MRLEKIAFKIQSYPVAAESDTDIPKCPQGHGTLEVMTNAKGFYILKCRLCGHEAS